MARECRTRLAHLRQPCQMWCVCVCALHIEAPATSVSRLSATPPDGFLVEILPVVPPKQVSTPSPAASRAATHCPLHVLSFALQVRSLLAEATWDVRRRTDDDVYASLLAGLQRRGDSPLSAAAALWSGVQLVAAQKRELTRETVRGREEGMGAP